MVHGEGHALRLADQGDAHARPQRLGAGGDHQHGGVAHGVDPLPQRGGYFADYLCWPPPIIYALETIGRAEGRAPHQLEALSRLWRPDPGRTRVPAGLAAAGTVAPHAQHEALALGEPPFVLHVEAQALRGVGLVLGRFAEVDVAEALEVVALQVHAEGRGVHVARRPTPALPQAQFAQPPAALGLEATGAHLGARVVGLLRPEARGLPGQAQVHVPVRHSPVPPALREVLAHRIDAAGDVARLGQEAVQAPVAQHAADTQRQPAVAPAQQPAPRTVPFQRLELRVIALGLSEQQPGMGLLVAAEGGQPFGAALQPLRITEPRADLALGREHDPRLRPGQRVGTLSDDVDHTEQRIAAVQGRARAGRAGRPAGRAPGR
ncbi:hypothetical protein OSTOST_10571 [Ostertagia ostertagi]